MEELKPCPFCGGRACVNRNRYVGVECLECGAKARSTKCTEGNEARDVVTKRWNSRVADTERGTG